MTQKGNQNPENSGIKPDLQPSMTSQAANEVCRIGLVPTMKIFQICIGSGWAATHQKKKERKKKWPQKSIKDTSPRLPSISLSLSSLLHHLSPFLFFCWGFFQVLLCFFLFFLLVSF